MSPGLAESAPRRPRSRALRARAVRFAERVTTPLVPSDYLDLFDPLRSATDLRGRIVAIQPETDDAVSLFIRPGRGWRTHTPGQYVRVGVDVEGVRRWRAYSLTSPPSTDGHITITVKAMTDGVVSHHLVHDARVGTILQLDGPCGEFTLAERMPPKVLFLTAGSGITPIMGMLRGHREQLRDVIVLHSAPADRDVIFASELRALSSEGRIRLLERHTLTDGQLDFATIASLVPDLAERETWACGPPGLLDLTEAGFAEAGWAGRLHTERFRPTLLAAGTGGTVTFTGSQSVVEADGRTPLLDVGEAAGVVMPFGCRMGICFGCVAPLSAGTVCDLRSGELTTAAPGDGVLIQTCVSAAAGACHIDL